MSLGGFAGRALVMDLHWDTSVGENPCVWKGVIGPIMVQKEFKTLVFILVSF